MLRFLTAAIAVTLIPVLCASSSGEEKTSYVDLEAKMNRKLVDNLGGGAAGNSLATLPTGEQTLSGIKFKIGPGIVQLGSTVFATWPEKVEGIAVDRQVSKLHFLHATCNGGGPSQEGDERYVHDGTLIGQYVVYYEDGGTAEIPIVYGQDVRDWWYLEGEAAPSRARVTWTGDNDLARRFDAHLRLYSSSWTNPKPDKRVSRIDYSARKTETAAAPFCLAISVEQE